MSGVEKAMLREMVDMVFTCSCWKLEDGVEWGGVLISILSQQQSQFLPTPSLPLRKISSASRHLVNLKLYREVWLGPCTKDDMHFQRDHSILSFSSKLPARSGGLEKMDEETWCFCGWEDACWVYSLSSYLPVSASPILFFNFGQLLFTGTRDLSRTDF